MAKPSNKSRSHVFASAFGRHLGALAEHAPGARKASAPVAIHKLRVAGRRLRATLDLFADLLPTKRRRRWRKAFKRLGQKSGAARDLDVQIAFVSDFLKQSPKSRFRPGLERLRLRLQQERRAVQPDVAAAVDRLAARYTLDECQSWLDDFKNRPEKKRPKQARRMALGFLLCHYIRVLSFDAFVGAANDPAKLHEMRIAVKHFRYALEILEPLFSAGFREQIAQAKSWQEQLGEIHDCDVWLARLPHFLTHEHVRFEAFFGHADGFAEITPGIDHLLADRRRRREECLCEFQLAWKTERHAPCWLLLLEH